MMYKNTPSQAASEAFLLWYIQNMKAYWEQEPAAPACPVLKSIVALPGFQAEVNKVAAIKDWVPGRQDLRRAGHRALTRRWPRSTAASHCRTSPRPFWAVGTPRPR